MIKNGIMRNLSFQVLREEGEKEEEEEEENESYKFQNLRFGSLKRK